MYVMDQQSKWEDYLPLVEFAYNNSYHHSLSMAPYELWKTMQNTFKLGYLRG